MNVLIVGSGGREHALAWKVKQSSKVDKVYCAPGNGGMAQLGECVAIDVNDTSALIKFAKEKEIGLTIVGPEAPLVSGIVDEFEQSGLKVFGPRQNAARLEESKIFSKEFMQRMKIPTAVFKVFENPITAKEFLDQSQFPVVVKADGLAAGKGVIICQDQKEALDAIENMMVKKVFGESGSKILIEECLEGEEASILVISDGDGYVMLDSSQDHKRIFDDDLGPNTGGMGAYCPAPIVTDEVFKAVEALVVEPTIRGMKEEGNPFKGVLYAGLMLTSQGPMVLEFNVRFGDPEAQAVIPRLKTDLMDVLLASCDSRLKDMTLQWDERHCVTVVMSSGGYPGDYEKGKVISGIEQANERENTVVFHAGTKSQGEKIVTSGGRVLGVTSLGKDLPTAIEEVYKSVEMIEFEKHFFRRDIGAKALSKSQVTSEKG